MKKKKRERERTLPLRWIFLFLLAGALLWSFPSGQMPAQAWGPGDFPYFTFFVTIPDENLDIALHEACGKSPLEYHIPLNIVDLFELEGNLDLDNRNIRDLEGIQHCTNVEWLFASRNPLSSLPDLKAMDSLIYLGLDECQFTKIPEGISELPQLKYLNMSNNQIRNLEALKDMDKLVSVNLRGNRIASVPQNLGLASLTEIDLSENRLTAFPDSILDSTQLEVIRLAWNQIKSLPDKLGTMTHLRSLYLHNNLLERLPANLGSTPLEYLDVSMNRLTSLPADLFKAEQLTEFIAGANRLTSLPSTVTEPHYDLFFVSGNYLDLTPGPTLNLLKNINASEKYYEHQLTPIRDLKAEAGMDWITLSWKPCKGFEIDGYEGQLLHYEVFLVEGGSWTSLGKVNKNTTTFTDSGLVAGTERTYSVGVFYNMKDSITDDFPSAHYAQISAVTLPQETTTVTTEPFREPSSTDTSVTQIMGTEPSQTQGPSQAEDLSKNDKDNKKGILFWLLIILAPILLLAAVIGWVLVIRLRKKKASEGVRKEA